MIIWNKSLGAAPFKYKILEDYVEGIRLLASSVHQVTVKNLHSSPKILPFSDGAMNADASLNPKFPAGTTTAVFWVPSALILIPPWHVYSSKDYNVIDDRLKATRKDIPLILVVTGTISHG